MGFTWNRKPQMSPEDAVLLAEARARVELEREKIEREKRLYQILVTDPLDYDTLVRIGKRVDADTLEILNKDGTIVRYFYKTNQVQAANVEEEQAIRDGLW